MSAICGFINLNNMPVAPPFLRNFNNSLSEFGGDRQNIWISNHIGLGQQMSFLTPESFTELLPYYDNKDQVAITADIRLFNRKELCSILNLKNEVCLSDSQIILKLYLKLGKSFTEHLLGEYSIAIYNSKTRELLLFTDHFNHFPIYYYQDKNIFAFATTIAALNNLPMVSRSINFKKIALSAYFTAKNYPGETFFTNINFIPPASIMTILSNGIHTIQHYWQPRLPEVRKFKTEDEFTEAFQDIFNQVLTGTTRTHLPVCTLLSGGLDSSSITAMACHVLAGQKRNITSFSAVLPYDYSGDVKDESYYINLLQADNLTKLNINDQGYGPFDNLTAFINTPMYSSRIYLYRNFNQSARELSAKLILDGCFGEIGPSNWGDEYLGNLFSKFKLI